MPKPRDDASSPMDVLVEIVLQQPLPLWLHLRDGLSIVESAPQESCSDLIGKVLSQKVSREVNWLQINDDDLTVCATESVARPGDLFDAYKPRLGCKTATVGSLKNAGHKGKLGRKAASQGSVEDTTIGGPITILTSRRNMGQLRTTITHRICWWPCLWTSTSPNNIQEDNTTVVTRQVPSMSAIFHAR